MAVAGEIAHAEVGGNGTLGKARKLVEGSGVGWRRGSRDAYGDVAYRLAAVRGRDCVLKIDRAFVARVGAHRQPAIVAQLNPGGAHIDRCRGVNRLTVDAGNVQTRAGTAQGTDGNLLIDLG